MQSEGGSSLSKDSPVGRREPAPGQERSCLSVWRQGHGEPGTEKYEADLDCIALGLGGPCSRFFGVANIKASTVQKALLF